MNLKDRDGEELMASICDSIHCEDEDFFNEVKAELLSRLAAGQKAIAAMKQIGDLVYNCSCHADTSNAVTKIFMEYERFNNEKDHSVFISAGGKMNENCLDCKHSKGKDEGNYCYMFKKAPNTLPCGQHDKFKMERQITGQLITEHPEILAMMVASMDKRR